MQYDPKKSMKIALEDAALGMFVTAIEHNTRVNLTNAGRISSTSGIKKLETSGVRYVWVDPALSDHSCVFKPACDPIFSTTNDPKLQVAPLNKVQRTFRTRDVQHTQAKKLIEEAKGLVQKLLNQTFESNAVALEKVSSWADDMIESVLVDADALQCISALRQKDLYLLEHSVNVACLLVSFGKFLGLSKRTLKDLAIGGIIHDVGKTKVNDKILHKPGKLTPAEFEHMKLHQVFASEIILDVKGLSDVSRDVCLMHHEKLDGSGYPNGLKGEEIPLHGRMSAIVDIYDALTTDRCYKKGMSSVEAFKILLSLTPSHLDPELVYRFINCIGMYPVGSIVELSDGRVGIVWSSNSSQVLKPEVKCFYSRKYKRYIDVTMVDLKKSLHKINKAIAPSALEIDPTPFYQ